MDIKKIKAALKPFTDRAKGLDPGWAEDRRVVTLSIDWSELRVSDLRRAAEAYAELEAAKPLTEGGGVAEWRQAHDGLEPCPFCGTYAEVVHASHIRCGNIYNCDAETRLGPKAWNRRALVKEGVVERVTERMKWAGLNALDNTEFGEKGLGHKFGFAAMGEIFRAMQAAALPAPVSVQEQKT